MGKPKEEEIDTNKLKEFVNKYNKSIIAGLIVLLGYAMFEIGKAIGQNNLLNLIDFAYTCVLK